MRIAGPFPFSALLLSISLFFMGCPYSSEVPLGSKGDRIPEKWEGEWKRSGDDSQKMSIRKQNDFTFTLIKTEKGDTRTKVDTFECMVFKMGNTYIVQADSKGQADAKRYLFYKVEVQEYLLHFFEVTDNIREEFTSSAEMMAFFKQGAQLSYFYNKDEEEWIKIPSSGNSGSNIPHPTSLALPPAVPIPVIILYPPIFKEVAEKEQIKVPCNPNDAPTYQTIIKKTVSEPAWYEQKKMVYDSLCINCYWANQGNEKIELVEVPSEYQRIEKEVCIGNKPSIVSERIMVKPPSKTYWIVSGEGSGFTSNSGEMGDWMLSEEAKLDKFPTPSKEWSDQSGQIWNFIPTPRGFKVQKISAGSSTYEEYFEYRKNVFADKSGNRYYITAENQLLWLSKDNTMSNQLSKK